MASTQKPLTPGELPVHAIMVVNGGGHLWMEGYGLDKFKLALEVLGDGTVFQFGGTSGYWGVPDINEPHVHHEDWEMLFPRVTWL